MIYSQEQIFGLAVPLLVALASREVQDLERVPVGITKIERTYGARVLIPIGQTLRFEWGLRRGFRYRMELVRRVLYRARMWEAIPLPDWLFWAYPLLSPVEWLMFRLRRRRTGRVED